MNIFENASRNKLRFESPNGSLSSEDLWDLPLTSGKGRANLDDIARSIYKNLSDKQEGSFVPTPSTSVAVSSLTCKLDIVKHVIAAKVADREAQKQSAKNKERKEFLMGVLERKENAEFESMSKEDVLKELESLSE